MLRSEIETKLKEILLGADPSKKEMIETATEATNFKEDFGFSSVNMLYLMIATEESFGIRFENITMADVATLGSVIDYVEKAI